MPKTIEHVHWPDAPDLWMPYAPAIKVKGGTTVYLAGVTAAPVYHHHPHRPEEFDAMPRDMAGQARAALDNLKRGLDAVGAAFADVVTTDKEHQLRLGQRGSEVGDGGGQQHRVPDGGHFQKPDPADVREREHDPRAKAIVRLVILLRALRQPGRVELLR